MNIITFLSLTLNIITFLSLTLNIITFLSLTLNIITFLSLTLNIITFLSLTLNIITFLSLTLNIITFLSLTLNIKDNATEQCGCLIEYLVGKHIPLFLVSLLVFTFLFLPYTLLLLFDQWLQAISHLRLFSWVNSARLKPFLDSYHAPYKAKHRYWPGLLLVLRSVLGYIQKVYCLLSVTSMKLLSPVQADTH